MLQVVQRYRFAGKDDATVNIRPAVPKMERLVAEPSVSMRWSTYPRPRLVGSFIDIVLQMVKRLRRNTGNTLFIRLAVGGEVALHARTRSAHLVVTELTRKPALIGGVPKHPRCRLDMESVRDDRSCLRPFTGPPPAKLPGSLRIRRFWPSS